MDNLLCITLEAHNQGRNHHRWYSISVGNDLLQDWCVSICYGRSGQGGQKLRFGSSDALAMRKVVREHLLRRLSAPKRIGCPYRLAGLDVLSGFDASVWLPDEVMGRFFSTETRP